MLNWGLFGMLSGGFHIELNIVSVAYSCQIHKFKSVSLKEFMTSETYDRTICVQDIYSQHFKSEIHSDS